MIDRGDPPGNRLPQQYLGFTAALVMVSSSIRLTAWLQNSKKRAERSERLAWAESPRLSPLCYLHHRSPVSGPLIITVITPLPMFARDKNARELKLANAAITDMQMRLGVMLLRSYAKYTKELADAKAARCSAWWCCRWSSSVAHRVVPVSQCVKAIFTASGVDKCSLPLTGRHRWTGLFHLQREADHYAKTTGRNPEVY